MRRRSDLFLRITVALLAVTVPLSCSDSGGIFRLPATAGAARAAITISPKLLTLGYIGDEDQLSASIVGSIASGSGVALEWKSLNTAIATVDATGLARAVAEGTTQIVVRTLNLSDTATITVARLPASVQLDPDSLLFTQLGTTKTIKATLVDGAGQSVSDTVAVWRTNDDQIVSVSQSGEVTAVGQGVTTVTVTAGSLFDQVLVRVSVGPARLVVDPAALVLTDVGTSDFLTATAFDAAGDTLESPTILWSSADITVAIVEDGVVTAAGGGSTTVTATLDSVSAVAAVSVAQTAAALKVSPTAGTLIPGGSAQFAAIVEDRNGFAIQDFPVTWSTTDTSIATVDTTGLTTALAKGAAGIVATAGEFADTADVTVIEATVDSVALVPDSIVLLVGGSQGITASYFDGDGLELGSVAVWSSSNEFIAIVSGAGMVTGVGPGSAWVSARAGAGMDSVHVTVDAEIAPPPPAEFDIQIRFVGAAPTSTQQAAFAAAEARWEDVVRGDLSGGTLALPAGACGVAHPGISETIDDLLVWVVVASVDGTGGVLAEVGPCVVRTSNGLPIVSTIRLDAADASALEGTGNLNDAVLRELGHALGFGNGNPWDSRLVGGGNPYWPGTNAVLWFTAAGLASATPVPVENTGGLGIRNAHWRESSLGRELMTGFINSGVSNPLSAITIGAMQDMGYVVNIGGGDVYPPAALRSLGAEPVLSSLRETLVGPRAHLDARGRLEWIR